MQIQELIFSLFTIEQPINNCVSHSLTVNLLDVAAGHSIEMKSKKHGINVCKGLLIALEHLRVICSVLK